MVLLLAFHCDAESVRIVNSPGRRQAHRHVGRSNGSLSYNTFDRLTAGGEVFSQSPNRPLTAVRTKRLGAVGLRRFFQQPNNISSRGNQRMLHVGVVFGGLLLPVNPIRPQADNRGLQVSPRRLISKGLLIVHFMGHRL
jgi:hypothetical protein